MNKSMQCLLARDVFVARLTVDTYICADGFVIVRIFRLFRFGDRNAVRHIRELITKGTYIFLRIRARFTCDANQLTFVLANHQLLIGTSIIPTQIRESSKINIG